MDKKKLFLICLCTGFFGGHYYAIGKFKKGLLYTFTVGLFFIGWFHDLYRIATTDDFIEVVEGDERRMQLKRQEIVDQQKMESDKIKDYQKEGIPYCPKCHSTHLTANKKGFGVGKAAAGAMLAGPYGLLAGGLGGKKIIITCLNCGYKFKPGRRLI